jgi:four helix bundle protein
MSDYRNLLVWQKAMHLAESVYLITAGFPRDERFGLISQLRRAAVSVASNIAEGQGRGNDGHSFSSWESQEDRSTKLKLS